MGNKVFTFGDIRIREIKGKYYVYLIEKDNEGNRRDHYVGPLDKVVKIALWVLGGTPPNTVDRPGLEPGTSRVRTEHSSRLSYRPTQFGPAGT